MVDRRFNLHKYKGLPEAILPLYILLELLLTKFQIIFLFSAGMVDLNARMVD
jgi:hypothetical protein